MRSFYPRHFARTQSGLALVAFAFTVTMLGTTLPTPLYPLYQREFHISPLIVTIVFAVYAIAVIAGLLLFGHQSDRIGRRPVLLMGLGLSALSAVAFIFAHDVGLVYAGRVLSGLSAGVFTGAGTAAMVDYAPAERRRATTLLAVVMNVGGLALGPLIAGLLAQYEPNPLRLPYEVDLALVFAAIGGVLWMRETVQDARGTLTLSVQHLRVPQEIRGIFIQAAIVGACAFAVSGVFSSVTPVFLGTQLHVHAPAIAGVLLFLFMGTSALGQFLVDRIPKNAAFAVGCGCLIVGLGCLAGSIALRSLAFIMISAVIGGCGQGIVMGFGLANINERITERRGEVTSAYFVLLYAGLALPVVAVGLVAVPLGLSTAGILFCGIVGLTVLAVVLRPVHWMRGEGRS